MAGESQSTVGYIQHHLTNLTYGKLPAGFERLDESGHVHEVLSQDTWTIAHSGAEASGSWLFMLTRCCGLSVWVFCFW